jgi:hypothetical protein
MYLEMKKRLDTILTNKDVDSADWFEDRIKDLVDREWREVVRNLANEADVLEGDDSGAPGKGPVGRAPKK